jgi:hypothetical protein
MHEASDGNISKFDNDEIAEAAMYDGDPDEFVNTLLKHAVLDSVDNQVLVHEWAQHGGKLIEKQHASAKRQEKWRNNSGASHNAQENEDNVLCNDNVTVTERVREEKKREEKKREEGTRENAPGPLSPDSPLGKALREVTEKQTLALSSFDLKDFNSVLRAFNEAGVKPSQIEEFGRKWPQHWKGRGGSPPKILEVQELWGAVLKFKEPGDENNGNSNTNGHKIGPAAAAAAKIIAERGDG